MDANSTPLELEKNVCYIFMNCLPYNSMLAFFDVFTLTGKRDVGPLKGHNDAFYITIFGGVC